MGYVLGFLASGFIALAGAGGGVIALNISTQSPRLLVVGIISAIIGIGGGGLILSGAGRR